ncbi:KR-domain-containing protein [Aspergillus coremiiformis]|uniref:KR-domain-containing protein n=1 Tax=Aspergillus coremiiformis TaxID=138285 RepID=A0A5N6Z0Z3_9EURO|nr:KR-domain-containing protein [Aspergillus coremiiformis]
MVLGLVVQLGQAKYVAGNTFLDSFTAYPLQQGLRACSVNLDPTDVGYLNNGHGAMLSQAFETRGWTPIYETMLHRILRLSIHQQTHQLNPHHIGQLVMAIMPGETPFEPLHRFSALAGHEGSTSRTGAVTDESKTKLTLLKTEVSRGTDCAILLDAALEVVNPVLMRSLGVGEPLDPTRPLVNYGVDSLVAVSALGIVGARTLTTLCENLLHKLSK